MYHDFSFAERLSKLRIQRGVSARDMSLSLGQNPSYINKIETNKAMPSMEGFFYICDFLQIHPSEFFCQEINYPEKVGQLTQESIALTWEQLDHVLSLVRDLTALNKGNNKKNH